MSDFGAAVKIIALRGRHLEFRGGLLGRGSLVSGLYGTKPLLIGSQLVDGPGRRFRRFGFLGHAALRGRHGGPFSFLPSASQTTDRRPERALFLAIPASQAELPIWHGSRGPASLDPVHCTLKASSSAGSPNCFERDWPG
jgi:hypothetical protein